MKSQKPAPGPDDIALHPDAWERFVRAVRKFVKQPLVKHPTQHGDATNPQAWGCAPGTAARQQMYRAGRGCFVTLLLLGAAACAPPPQANQETTVCPEVIAPVCAVHLDTKESYWNECKARRDGAILAIPGECPIPYGYDFGSP
jgi:hypothetical protein